MKRLARRGLPMGIAAILFATGLGGGSGPMAVPATRVLIIGGSAARGWHDRTGQGYVVRGLQQWAKAHHAALAVANRAVPGATVKNPTINQGYAQWLTRLHPQVVVVAWGMLNDLREHVPLQMVMSQLHRWIAEALGAHATVFVVTPMATTATYTIDRSSEAAAVKAELRMARSFAGKPVYTFNVIAPMQRYLAAHHQPVTADMAGAWDPNTRGHRLAGGILGAELLRRAPSPGAVGPQRLPIGPDA